MLRKQQTATATIIDDRARSFSDDGELSPSSSSDDTHIGAPPRKTLKPLWGGHGRPVLPPDDGSDRSMSLKNLWPFGGQRGDGPGSAGDNFSGEFSRGSRRNSDAGR